MLSNRKTLFSHIKKYIPKVLWYILCIVIIVTTIVILSKHLYEVSYLRKWTNERSEYVPILPSVNASTVKKFFKWFNSNSSADRNTFGENNYTILNVDEGVGEYEPNTALSNSGEQEENVNNTCKPIPPRDDFSKCGNRVANRKCCEYIWAWKYKDDLMEIAECNTGFGIVGGAKVKPGEFPHMVALGFKRKDNRSKYDNGKKSVINQYSYKCGGSLISEQFVLTAAHCTQQATDKNCEKLPSIVVMGGEQLSQQMMPFKIETMIRHRKYAPPKKYYDIALIKLVTPVTFSYTIHPACLSTELVPRYKEVNITGWGITNPFDSNNMSDHLLVATLNIVSREKCLPLAHKYHRNRNFKGLKYHQLCAVGTTRGVDTCQGDSGGPLQVRINTTYGNIHRVTGVTSFGRTCGSEAPSIYVSVSSLITWIEKIVWPEYNEDYYEGFNSK